MTPGGITFAVDDVTPATAPLPPRDAMLDARFGATPLARSADATDVVEVDERPALLLAVELAFTQHRPLLLTPDAVWLTIAQGFARHVRTHAEALRSRFVRHDGRKVLRAVAEEVQTPAAWEHIVSQFAAELGSEVGPGLVRALTCDFSTTTPAARTASEVVLMDTFRKYFDYEVLCICGIPRVTLAGTVADWEHIRARLDVLREYELAWWIDALIPVADEWVKTARGEVDRDFWQCIYQPEETYGGENVTGWLARLFPYHDEEGKYPQDFSPPVPRPGLVARLKSLAQDKRRSRWLSQGMSKTGGGSSLSRVPVRLIQQEGASLCAVIAGLLGVGQLDGGELFPRIGWVVVQDSLAQLWEDLLKTARVRPPIAGEPAVDFVPAVLMEFYAKCDGCELLDGEIVIRGKGSLETVQLNDNSGVAFANLKNGARLLYVRQPRGHGEQVMSQASHESEPRVLAHSMLEFFQGAAQSHRGS